MENEEEQSINISEDITVELGDFLSSFLTENENINYSILSNEEIINFTDLNNSNLLMKAIESEQNLKFINKLLSLPFDINQKSFDDKTAADIAYEKKNDQILLRLLEANATYPNEFDIDETTDDIREFLKVSNEMHEAIKTSDAEKIIELIMQKPNLRYFYNSLNVSAATVALDAKNYSIYEMLLQNDCSIGPNENFNEIYSNADNLQITKAHDNVSKNLPEKHLMILCANSVVCHDDQFFKLRVNHIRDAFNNLNEIPLVRQILQLTSMHNNFKIHFDFNRSSVEFMNPYSGDQSTRGSCDYVKLKQFSLYVAVNELLIETNKFTSIGTLAHELCHFAVNLTFCNDAKPYAIDDEENKVKFDEIIEKYQDIIEHNRIELLKRRMKIEKFNRLTTFCEFLSKENRENHKSHRESQILELERNIEFNNELIELKVEEIRKCIEKISQNKQKVLKLNDKFGYEKEIEKLKEESLKLQEQIYEMKIQISETNEALIIDSEMLDECKEEIIICSKNSIEINNCQMEISMLEDEIEEIEERVDNERIIRYVFNYSRRLWPSELIVRVPQMISHYQNNSERLKQLKETFKELFDYYHDFVMARMSESFKMLEKLFNNLITINYSDLTDAYKAKIHHSNVEFQDFDIKFYKVIGDKNSEVFEKLSSAYIRGFTINNSTLTIGFAQEIDTKFYIERDFVNHDARISMDHDNKLNLIVYTDKMRAKMINFDQISWNAGVKKTILLSDDAGHGKTTTFKQLTLKLKEKFPNYWISYVDLKQHLSVYENYQDFHETLTEILEIDGFDVEVFNYLYNCGKVIFLFDGVDEISPRFNEIFMKIVEKIRETKNQQWIASRPQHMEELIEKFNQKAYKLLPFDDVKNIEFIQQVLEENPDNIEAERIAKEIYKSLDNSVSKYEKIVSPLMLRMITELYLNDKTIVREHSKYSLYYKMFKMNIETLYDKGKVANQYCDNPDSKITIWQVHQVYALKLLYPINEIKKPEVKKSANSEKIDKIKKQLAIEVRSKIENQIYDEKQNSFAVQILNEVENINFSDIPCQLFHEINRKVNEQSDDNLSKDEKIAKITQQEIDQRANHLFNLILKEAEKRVENEDIDELTTINVHELLLLKKWKKKVQGFWTPEAISRYGFLIVDHWSTANEFPDFLHRTFAEFFVVQYIIQNVYELDEDDEDEISEKEVRLRLNLLFTMTMTYGSNIFEFISSYIDDNSRKKLMDKILKSINSDKMRKFIDKNIHYEGTIKTLKFFTTDERFLKEFRIDDGTMFQKYFNSCSVIDDYEDIDLLLKVIELYEKSLGSEWYLNTGYAVDKISIDSNLTDYIHQISDDDDDDDDDDEENYLDKKIKCELLFKLLRFIEHAEIPSETLKNFLSQNFRDLLVYSLRSFSMIQKLSMLFQNNLKDDIIDVLKENIINRSKNNLTIYEVASTDEYLSNVLYLCEHFEVISSMDIRVDIFASFCGIKSLKNLKYCTRKEIQNYLIKKSILIVKHIGFDNFYASFLDEFEDFLREIFLKNDDDDDGKSQLRHFLKSIKNNNVKNSYMMNNESHKKIKNALKKLSQEIEFEDEEIESLIKEIELLKN